jgi:hypothetical protein
MSYSDILKPRRDVLSEEGIEGIIDLANLDDRRRRKLEARPADFFNLTYPTARALAAGRTYEVKQPGERLTNLMERFGGLSPTVRPSLFPPAHRPDTGARSSWIVSICSSPWLRWVKISCRGWIAFAPL